jgi:hypothetical protein
LKVDEGADSTETQLQCTICDIVKIDGNVSNQLLDMGLEMESLPSLITDEVLFGLSLIK